MMTRPLVSILILTLNGRELLGPCLDSVLGLDYPADRVEIIVGDNGSTDGSPAWLRQRYPQVTVIEFGANLGFARAYNRMVERARGELVALLNDDTRVHPAWLTRLVEGLDPARRIVCTTSLMYNDDGSKLSFGGMTVNFCGYAYQAGEGLPAAAAADLKPAPIFAPCGGAMLIVRAVFRELGGFDEDLFAFYEDTDLGWRLWLGGDQNYFIPESIVYHARGKTWDRRPADLKFFYVNRNPLLTIIKNYETATLTRVLPAALLLAVERLAAAADAVFIDGELRSEIHRLQPGETVTIPLLERLREVTTFALVLRDVLDRLPRWLEKRAAVQARRQVSDRDLFTRVRLTPDFDEVCSRPPHTLALLKNLELFRLGELFDGQVLREYTASRFPRLEAELARMTAGTIDLRAQLAVVNAECERRVTELERLNACEGELIRMRGERANLRDQVAYLEAFAAKVRRTPSYRVFKFFKNLLAGR